MWWLWLCAIVLLSGLLIFRLWRKWGAPWKVVLEMMRAIGAGKQPRTFLIEGCEPARQAALALEEIFVRQQQLDRQLVEQTVGAETIFSAMDDALLVLDGDGRITVINQAARNLFGLRDESLGSPLVEAVREPAIGQAVSDAVASNRPIRLELTMADRQLRFAAVPMRDHQERVTGIVVLLHDITELKRADRIRAEFVANVSHELRTPLSILRGYIETLRDDPEISAPERSRILEVMERHSKRLGLLVNDLLTLAQLESHTAKLELSEIDLPGLFREIGRDWEKRFSTKKLQARFDIAPDLPLLRADEARLREIFDNLLDNAVKYSEPGGLIRLKAERDDGEVVLSVSNDGVGVSQEDLPRIFERFYRADKARSREMGGTGLGLSIVKHIAQLHGGRVEARSEPGQETTIRVILPRL